MTDKGRRFSKGVAIALAVHLVVAALLGVFGYRFTQRPPQILEVTLGGGGGGGGKGSESERQTSPPAQQPKQQMAKPKADDIVDQKQKPQPRREEQPQPKQRERATSEHAQSNVKSGEAGAAGSGSGSGAGSGSGSGAGSGSGSGAGQGSGAGVPVTPPYLVASTDPRYPPAARNREIEGTVYVKMLVNDGGSVESAFVARSSGNDALDGAAVEAVYNWRFSPAKDTLGSPVRCYITMPVNFVLH
ncbi:energy transducer TonB [uncultured Phascolarctobacterium sp.]|uniref:energy transducer TonB n=1 Tax=uncultured Phascolarctobacterium sp. TaxID=512296 RepID=UPI0015A85D88|nr:energy transducer TonB [uncultured Phascolarctobacterium sp.]